MLPDWEAPYLQSLIRTVEGQSKATLVGWCANYAERWLLPIYETTYPSDLRPRKALQAAQDWLAGTIKLPEAKTHILACHAAARESEGAPAAQAAARAIGQAASTIHATTHCAGLALYGALAEAYDSLGPDADWPALEQAAAQACGRMEQALSAVAIENEPNPAKLNWKC